MPSDASIYNLIRPQQRIEYVSPEERAFKQARLRQLMGAQEMQDLQLGQARQGIATQGSIQDLFRRNPNATADDVAPIDYQSAAKMRKEAEELAGKRSTRGKAEAETVKIDTETKIKQSEVAASILDFAMKNPAAYPQARAIIEKSFPTLGKQLPPEFDPVAVGAQIEAGRTFVQKMTDQRAREQQAETGRHNIATEGTAAANLRVSQGNLGLSRERLTLDKNKAVEGRWTNDLERGVQVNMATGETRPITSGGQPISNTGKPLTEAQGRGQMFGTRAAESDKILAGLEDKISTAGLAMKRGAEDLPLVGGMAGAAGNVMLSADQQMVEQAQRNFVNAVLRQESGAVISPSEFENAQKQYFPQPGDSAKVRDQKRQNRQSAIEGFRVMSGPAGQRIEAARRTPQDAGGKIKFLGFE